MDITDSVRVESNRGGVTFKPQTAGKKIVDPEIIYFKTEVRSWRNI